MAQAMYHNGNFWFDLLADIEPLQAPTAFPEQVDVAIVGAGFTGLWSAYYLKAKQPELVIGVFEAKHVGFGASGRNGGWCMGTAEGISAMLESDAERSEGITLMRAMQDTVDEVGRVCQAENIDCHYAKGGTLTIARYPHEVDAMKKAIDFKHSLGFDDDDFTWIPQEASSQRLAAEPNLGASYTKHCAAIHPGRLVRGLGERVRAKGVEIFEDTPVLRIEPGIVTTQRGQVRAGKILRATEGYTGSIAGQARTLMPLYTHMIATQPLDDDMWRDIGLARRETFDDGRHLTIYGQRTLDNRLAFGGCLEYYFGSKLLSALPQAHPNFAKVESAMKTMLPMLSNVKITHKWGGLFGVPRRGRPFVQFDRETGIGAAGGYVGEGVGASNLAARALVDLTLGRATALTELAWVRETPTTWPAEPLRWLGSRAVRLIGNQADASEAKTGRPSKWAGRVLGAVFGRAS